MFDPLTEYITTLIMLVMVHFICDYSLQNDFVSKYKSPKSGNTEMSWWIIMTAHASTHAAGVWLITGSLLASIIQFVSHYIIDTLKCLEFITFKEDQGIHLVIMAILALMIFVQ